MLSLEELRCFRPVNNYRIEEDGHLTMYVQKLELVDRKFWSVWYEEAQRKYERMHTDSEEKRFEKTIVGILGEVSVALFLIEVLKANLCLPVEKQLYDKYDEGDICFIKNSRKRIVNVSSRKIPETFICSVYLHPEWFFALIPVDQYNQYQKVDLSFYTFLSLDNFFHDLKSTTLIAGFLKREDLFSLQQQNYLKTLPKGTRYKGLFSDSPNSVLMYTDNYIVPVNLLRPLHHLWKTEQVCQEGS